MITKTHDLDLNLLPGITEFYNHLTLITVFCNHLILTHDPKQTSNLTSKMAAASSEGSPTTPTNSTQNEKSASRSPSVSSLKEYQWTGLFVSRPITKKILKSRGKRRVFTCNCNIYRLVITTAQIFYLWLAQIEEENFIFNR